MDLDLLAVAIDHLGESEPSAFADVESIVFLERQLARLEAAVAEAAAAFDAAANWVPDGALNATSWLTTRCRLRRGEARAQVRRGRGLRRLPECAQAWRSGDITGAHVDVIASLRSEATEEALIRDESLLVSQAGNLRVDLFVRAAAYWKQMADPIGADSDGARRRGRRDVYLVKSFNDVWLGRMVLDPMSGSIVSNELERLERQLFEADCAEAQELLGRPASASELARTHGQRRADALVEMATRSGTAPPTGRRPAPLVTVLVGWETLHGRLCELADGTVIPPGSFLPWLDGASVERVVFGPDNRVDVSATARLFSGATRRAIEVRDRECTHPYCDVPASRCQVDHIQPWAEGGLTTQENGRLLCGGHNRQRNGHPPPDG